MIEVTLLILLDFNDEIWQTIVDLEKGTEFTKDKKECSHISENNETKRKSTMN
ncbi:MAG: hypothetical protein K2Y30_13995 [Flavobacteriaceae bacterium]|nr:hypothetical protein [Flavobacteriaceae bacterium]